MKKLLAAALLVSSPALAADYVCKGDTVAATLWVLTQTGKL